MLLEVTELRELALTDLALVRLQAGVYAGVLREIGRVGKAFGTCRAFVGLGVLFVDLLAVDQHVRLGCEHLGIQGQSVNFLLIHLHDRCLIYTKPDLLFSPVTDRVASKRRKEIEGKT